ncbi:MAG: hypothetical protein FJ144_07985 [Deltaproteobacteria bacterium]|nr:hypothetical protein [Deltaproteobacteria bacterium]
MAALFALNAPLIDLAGGIPTAALTLPFEGFAAIGLPIVIALGLAFGLVAGRRYRRSPRPATATPSPAAA